MPDNAQLERDLALQRQRIIDLLARKPGAASAVLNPGFVPTGNMNAIDPTRRGPMPTGPFKLPNSIIGGRG